MNGSLVAELNAPTPPTDVDVILAAAKLGSQFLTNLAGALETYKATGHLPALEASELSKYNELVKSGKDSAKRRKKAGEKKLNKDGSEKQPRKPTAYNYWMQKKLKELKEEAGLGSEEKHVDRFKAAAEFWRAMPTEEKEAVNADFKAKVAAGLDPSTAAPMPGEAEATSSEEDDDHHTQPSPGAYHSPAAHHHAHLQSPTVAVPAPVQQAISSDIDDTESDDEAAAGLPPQLISQPPKPKPVEPKKEPLEMKKEKKKKRKQEHAPAQIQGSLPQMTPPVQAAPLQAAPVQAAPVQPAAAVIPGTGEKKKKKKKLTAAAQY